MHSGRIQARYDPAKYPLLEEWWTSLPKGVASRQLCEVLEMALSGMHATVVEAPVEFREELFIPSPKGFFYQEGEIVYQMVRKAITDVLHEQGDLTFGVVNYGADPSSGTTEEEAEDWSQVRGLLDGIDQW